MTNTTNMQKAQQSGTQGTTGSTTGTTNPFGGNKMTTSTTVPAQQTGNTLFNNTANTTGTGAQNMGQNTTGQNQSIFHRYFRSRPEQYR